MGQLIVLPYVERAREKTAATILNAIETRMESIKKRKEFTQEKKNRIKRGLQAATSFHSWSSLSALSTLNSVILCFVSCTHLIINVCRSHPTQFILIQFNLLDCYFLFFLFVRNYVIEHLIFNSHESVCACESLSSRLLVLSLIAVHISCACVFFPLSFTHLLSRSFS